MAENRAVSRRAFVVGAGVTSVLSVRSTIAETKANSPDAQLIALGRELEAIPKALERACEHDQAIAILDRIDTLTAAIVAMPAKSLNGLYVKARATSWALSGDFDPSTETSNDMRVVVSLLRDLIQIGKSDHT